MVCRFLSISLALALFAVLALRVDDDLDRGRLKGVVVLSVESLRADMVRPDTTPRLLAAFEKGLRFSNHRAISAWTGTNIVSLLTGLSPFTTGVHTRGQTLDPGLTVPLKQLAERGFRVQGLQPFMAMDIYQHLGLTLSPDGGDPRLWLAHRRERDDRFFLWHHYVHTHLPYQAPSLIGPDQAPPDADTLARLEKVRTRAAIHHDEASFAPQDVAEVRRLHLHAIREFDQWFGAFWTFFTRSGFHRDTLLIVTADHGDEYGERGQVGHASTTLAGHLHEEIVRVPLLVWLPEHLAIPAAVDLVTGVSSHADIMPTILALLGVEPAIPLDGRNLLDSAARDEWTAMTSSGGFAEPDPARVRYFEYSRLAGGWKSRLRLHADGSETLSLYHLETDPAESSDLAGSHPDIAAAHRAALEERIARQVIRPVTAQDDTIGEEDAGPRWVRPKRSGTYGYNDLGGRFHLEWSGGGDRDYLIDYLAGTGAKEIAGTLEVRGNRKDFGTIDRRYWQTWIVPQSPYRLRVREVGGTAWSPWLKVEAVP